MLLRPTDGETDHTRATERRRRGALDEYVEGVMGEMEKVRVGGKGCNCSTAGPTEWRELMG